MATQYPEGRVLIIMTGGTICRSTVAKLRGLLLTYTCSGMKSSPEGLVPARGFLQAGMAPRPSFNDGSNPGKSSYLYHNVLGFRVVLV